MAMYRRRYPRIKVDLPSHVSGEDDSDAYLDARCFSIGGGGFGFLLSHPFDVGSWLTVEIDLGNERLNARAVVVGCQPSDTEQGHWRISTQLEELPEEDRKRLDASLVGVQGDL